MIDNFTKALELSKAIKTGEISASYVVNQTYKKILETENKVNAFIRITIEEAMKVANIIDKLPLSERKNLSNLIGVPIAVKDSIVTKGIPTTAASYVLENWIPPYNSTVVNHINKALLPVIGKTNLDEFAMGSTTKNSFNGSTLSFNNPNNCVGGSSGGSAVAVQSEEVYLSIGSDTGGSIRQPASLCNVFGYKPTFGKVSRYGLIAFASSLDQIGVFARNIDDLTAIYSLIASHDEKDLLSNIHELKKDKILSTNKIAIIEDYLEDKELDPKIKKAIQTFIEKKINNKNNFQIETVKNDCFNNLIELYKIIAYSEAFSNLNRYDGSIYGKAIKTTQGVNEYRESLIGLQVMKRITSGNILLSEKSGTNYYRRAMIWRNQLTKYIDNLFNEYTILIAPANPYRSLSLNSVREDQNHDKYTVLGNLAGLPGISIPISLDNGEYSAIQLYAARGNDTLLLKLAKKFIH